MCRASIGNCGYKAFKIVGGTVSIDTCYDNESKIFTNDKSAFVSDNVLYRKVTKLTSSAWRQIETDIAEVITCDATFPFEITLMKNSKIETYSIKRISECYPKSTKNVMEELDDFFAKMQ